MQRTEDDSEDDLEKNGVSTSTMNPLSELKEQAQDEAYEYFDKHIRKLERLPNGKVNPHATGLHDNDVDAFRHAYVSGVFTQEYSESVADILGRMNEFLTADLYSNSRDPRALNMDLWNNGVGRKYGKKIKGRKPLLKQIYKALRAGELIVKPDDLRDYVGERSNPENASKPVIVLAEDANGRNELFFDLIKKTILTREEFVAQIQSGNYHAYSVKVIAGISTPTSNPDRRQTNNLG